MGQRWSAWGLVLAGMLGLIAFLALATHVGPWSLKKLTGEAVQVMPYGDLVKSAQRPGVAPTRSGETLRCAARFGHRAEPARDDAGAQSGNVEPPPGSEHGERERMDDLLRRAEQRDKVLDGLVFEELLQQAEPGELAAAVLRRLWAAEARTPAAALTDSEKALSLWWTLDAEVNNGGFHQYFFNPSGDEAMATRDALARLGLRELLPLFDCALSAFPESTPSTDRDLRNDQLAAYGDTQFDLFEALDGAFYDLPNLDAAVEAYVRSHPKDFPAASQPLLANRGGGRRPPGAPP